MRSIIVIAHNIRSAHNIGSIFRTCEGFAVERLIISGYSPYPTLPHGDPRLPHMRTAVSARIHKTALGAESLVPFSYQESLDIAQLQAEGYRVVALEQLPTATPLHKYHPPQRIALLLGEEVQGVEPGLLSQCDDSIEIAMFGHKESFNVSVAVGIALYGLRMA